MLYCQILVRFLLFCKRIELQAPPTHTHKIILQCCASEQGNRTNSERHAVTVIGGEGMLLQSIERMVALSTNCCLFKSTNCALKVYACKCKYWRAALKMSLSLEDM